MSPRVEACFRAAQAEAAVAERESRFDRAAAVFHFQQAAEKLLKAALIAGGVDPPRTQDIAALWTRLARLGLVAEADDPLRATEQVEHASHDVAVSRHG